METSLEMTLTRRREIILSNGPQQKQKICHERHRHSSISSAIDTWRDGGSDDWLDIRSVVSELEVLEPELLLEFAFR